MKHNLSKKLFTITLGLLLGLMAATLIFQIFFFEGFYERKKKINLTKEITRFTSLYSNQIGVNNLNFINALQNFEADTNSKIGIFSSATYLPLIVSGKTDDINTLSAIFWDILNNTDLIQGVLNTGKPKAVTFVNKSSGNKKIGVVAPMSLYSKNDSLIISVAPIQPIEEASGVISEFYGYIFIGFIFISVLLSSIYSNLISKPLVNMNKVARKMSKMDFDEKCIVNREDEIGSLASTLNFLSTNLAGALDDLKEKNKKLEEDIEKERNLELMRKDFVASVSHELKTPIGIIEGYAEGLKDGIVVGQDAVTYLETIIDESKKMGILVSNMLELSKLESGVLKPNPEVFNINRLIKKVVSKLKTDAEDHGLSMEYFANTEYSYVKADVFQMEQVLTNLITNAIKYTPKENNIFVSIDEVDNSYVISIRNTGVQIDSNEIDKLFNKFYRSDKARTRNTNSTGLGLSIVKNILELHNSEYSLCNVENSVEFKFSLSKKDCPE